MQKSHTRESVKYFEEPVTANRKIITGNPARETGKAWGGPRQGPGRALCCPALYYTRIFYHRNGGNEAPAAPGGNPSAVTAQKNTRQP